MYDVRPVPNSENVTKANKENLTEIDSIPPFRVQPLNWIEMVPSLLIR